MNTLGRIKRKVTAKLYRFYTPINRLIIYLNGGKAGTGLKINGLLRISNVEGILSIGSNVRINSVSWANPIGFENKTSFQLIGSGQLLIGNNVGMSNVSITCAEKVVIHDNVLLGAGCKIYDTDFHPVDSSDRLQSKNENIGIKMIEIGENAFVGAGTIILKGVHIGENSIIGAGAVVTRNVPDNEIWGGNPARLIRMIERKQGT